MVEKLQNVFVTREKAFGRHCISRSVKQICRDLKFYGHILNSRNEFSVLARESKAVNIGQGFTDCAPPHFVTDAMKSVINGPDYMLHQYARGFVSFIIAIGSTVDKF